MVERHIQRYAHLPNGSLLFSHRHRIAFVNNLRPRHGQVVSSYKLPVPLSTGLLCNASRIQLQALSGCARVGAVGFLVLFSDYYCCRTHLEGNDVGFHPSHNWWTCAVLSGQVPLGLRGDSLVYGIPGGEQPHADDVLLPLCDALPLCGVFCGCAAQTYAPKMG